MKRPFCFLLAAVAMTGWGAEITPSHLAFFAYEPVEIFVQQGGQPELLWGGEPFSAEWTSLPEKGGTIWRAVLPKDAPLGVWLARLNDDSAAFLRVAADRSLLEVKGPAGLELFLNGAKRLIDKRGQAFFLVEPGHYALAADFAGLGTMTREVTPEVGKREEIVLAWAEGSFSSPVAIPGTTVRLTFSLSLPVDVPAFHIRPELPLGWSAEPEGYLIAVSQGFLWPNPVPSWTTVTFSLLIHIPEGASLGQANLVISFPDLGIHHELQLTVDRCLPIPLVISHWDTAWREIDLTLPLRISFDQILWATTMLGQEVPYTCGKNMDYNTLAWLTDLWANDQPVTPIQQ